MPHSLKPFTKIAGISVHYARSPIAPYGTVGKPRKFYANQVFIELLNNCFSELFTLCPLGMPDVITCAGTYVEKPGYHKEGKAFDLDGIFWKEKTFITLNYPAEPAFYLAIQSVIRKHFGTTLSYLYNAAHHDHLHFDEGGTVGFSSQSRSTVLFLQASLKHILNIPINIDGAYGSQTETAVAQALHKLNISGKITSNEVWLKFLTALAKTAFSSIIPPEDKNPSMLIEDIFVLIDEKLKNSPDKKTIEAAFNTFVTHAETQKWLKNFKS